MVAILKYNAGNITSVRYALQRLGFDSIITDEPEHLASASHVIFPGVGEAGSAMSYLKERKLDEVIKNLKQPVLGICLGLQLLCTHSEEADTIGLSVFPTIVRKFPDTDLVPHMGWNNLTAIHGSLLEGITTADNFYFVHSFYAEPCENTVGFCEYILPFSAVLQKDNFFATQFHPEKSGSVGEKILLNFLKNS